MKNLFVFIFSISFSSILAAQTTTAPAAATPPPPAISPAKQQKLETLWKSYEQTYGIGKHSINRYRKEAKNDPNVAKLDDPAVQEKALAELGKAFAQKANQTFTEAEMDYLIQLFSSSVSKKLGQLESKFWVVDTTAVAVRAATNPPGSQAPVPPPKATAPAPVAQPDPQAQPTPAPAAPKK